MCTPLTHRLLHYVQNMGERIAFYNLFICAVGWVIFDDLRTSPLKLKCWFCKFIFAHSPSEKTPNHIIIIQLSTNTRTVFLLTHSPGTAQSRPVMSVCMLCNACKCYVSQRFHRLRSEREERRYSASLSYDEGTVEASAIYTVRN